MNAKPSGRGRFLAIWGALFQLGPVLGMFGTLVGMMRTFNSIRASNEVVDPAQLADGISLSLLTSVAGLAFGIVGVVMLGISVIALDYRAPWLFQFLIVYGIVLLFVFPVGTAIGIVLLVFAVTKRQEFLQPPRQTDSDAVSG